MVEEREDGAGKPPLTIGVTPSHETQFWAIRGDRKRTLESMHQDALKAAKSGGLMLEPCAPEMERGAEELLRRAPRREPVLLGLNLPVTRSGGSRTQTGDPPPKRNAGDIDSGGVSA
jgi:hypothetical protein